MAAVYLGRDTRDGREVAVKVLARMRPSWVQRFSREFEAARRVNHPNVVRVLEAGEHEGTAYFSMERIGGVTAQRYVHGLRGDDPLPPPPPMEHSGPPRPIQEDQVLRTLRVAVQLTRAVAAIHRVGLVHRDLKPGNVLVTDEGVVKLVDFGVAKWLEEQNQFTQVGHVVGSYSYMSPEQITGSEVDHRADMYGMGVLIYELLFGAPPFRARRPQEYLWLHCTAAPEPLGRRLEGVPAELDTLVQRMLAKEPADRPESMAIIERGLLDIQAEREGRAAGATMEVLTTHEELPSVTSLDELPEVVQGVARVDHDLPERRTIVGQDAADPSVPHVEVVAAPLVADVVFDVLAGEGHGVQQVASDHQAEERRSDVGPQRMAGHGRAPNSASKLSSSWSRTASSEVPHSSAAKVTVWATFAGSFSASRSGPM